MLSSICLIVIHFVFLLYSSLFAIHFVPLLCIYLVVTNFLLLLGICLIIVHFFFFSVFTLSRSVSFYSSLLS